MYHIFCVPFFFFLFFRKTACQKYFFLKPFPKKARIVNLKNPDLDLIRKIHPECGFYGFMIQIWIFPKKTHPQPVLQGPVSLVRQLECKSIFLKVTFKKNTYKSDIQLTSMEIFGKSKLNELAIFYYL